MKNLELKQLYKKLVLIKINIKLLIPILNI